MIEIKDEVLDTSTQSIDVPLFNVKDENGTLIHSKVQIELDTPVIQEGNNLNKAFWEEIGFHAGMILMWSGAINTIPNGWNLCDGSNGTPDLRNRFVVGAGSSYTAGNTGGSNTVTLTTAQIPNHNHMATVSSDGSHTHTYRYTNATEITQRGTSTSGYMPTARSIDKDTESAGSHTHTVTIANTGGGTEHENRPPYYALAYIMKI